MRLRSNFLAGAISGDLASGTTTMLSPGLTAFPTVTSPDYSVVVLDPLGTQGNPEVVYVTAHSASSNSATIVRAREGTTARAHTVANAIIWRQTATKKDWDIATQGALTPEEFGAVGDGSTTDTTAFTDLLGQLNAQIQTETPTGATALTASYPIMKLRPGARYKIDNVLSSTLSHFGVFCPGQAIIDQADTTKNIFDFSSVRRFDVNGLVTTGGKKHFNLSNTNIDGSMFTFRRWEGWVSNLDWMIDVMPPPVATLTGAITSTAVSLTVSTATPFPAAPFAMSIDQEVMTVTAKSGTTFTVTRGTEGTGQGPMAHGNGATIYYPANMSATLTIESGSGFQNPYQALRNGFGVSAAVRDTWVELIGNSADGSVFDNYNQLLFERMYGVPNPNGPSANQHWVNNFQEFRAKNARFGGEGAGMWTVWNYCGPQQAYPFCQGGVVAIEDCFVAPGPDTTNSGIINAFKLPQQLILKNNYGILRNGQHILNDNTSGGLAAYITALAAGTTVNITVDDEAAQGEVDIVNCFPAALRTTNSAKVRMRIRSGNLDYIQNGTGLLIGGNTGAEACLELQDWGGGGSHWRVEAGREGADFTTLMVRDVTNGRDVAGFNQTTGDLQVGYVASSGLSFIGAGVIRYGAGVPSNALGANGDLYVRTDGGGAGATHLYYKTGGVYIGIA